MLFVTDAPAESRGAPMAYARPKSSRTSRATPDGARRHVKSRPAIKRRTTTAAEQPPVSLADDVDDDIDDVIDLKLPVKPMTSKDTKERNLQRKPPSSKMDTGIAKTTTPGQGRDVSVVQSPPLMGREPPRVRRKHTSLDDVKHGMLRETTKHHLTSLMSATGSTRQSSAACVIL